MIASTKGFVEALLLGRAAVEVVVVHKVEVLLVFNACISAQYVDRTAVLHQAHIVFNVVVGNLRILDIRGFRLGRYVVELPGPADRNGRIGGVLDYGPRQEVGPCKSGL